MESETCKICNIALPSENLGRHLRKHKVRLQEYMEEHYPKSDFYTQEKLTFKDRESYFLHDFENRRNLISFLTNNPNPKKDRYAILLLARHKKQREWNYQPSQVELRSSILPARNFYEKAFGVFAPICETVGLIPRFEDKPTIVIPPIKDDFRILIDTREQKPFSFNLPTTRTKLDIGDYTTIEPYFSGLYVERKTLVDFVNTLSQHYDRFQAEIDRAKALNEYVVVCVDVLLEEVMRFRIPQSKCSPVFIFHRLKQLMQKYDNLQFVFADGPILAAELTLKILLLGEQAKHIDLQYHNERRQLCGNL